MVIKPNACGTDVDAHEFTVVVEESHSGILTEVPMKFVPLLFGCACKSFQSLRSDLKNLKVK